MKTIVITGATSFLGRNVLKALIKEDYKVYAMVRENSSDYGKLPLSDKVTYIHGDLANLHKIEEAVTKADVFLHFAWDGSGKLKRADAAIQGKNVEYAMDALRLADRLGCQKFIFPGSQAEYGTTLLGRKEAVTEDAECNPVSEYGKAKFLFGERAWQYCMGKEMSFVHLRIFSVYGADDRPGTLVDSCIRTFTKGGHLDFGPCSQLWNFLYIDDLVRVVLEVVKQDCKGGIYHIGSYDTRILREFVEEIHELAKGLGSYSFGSEDNNPEKSPSLVPNIDKITSTLLWEPKVSFTDGVKYIMINLLKGDE